MSFFNGNIEQITLDNADYRRVLFTSPNRRTQLVVMSLKPKQEIGMETHPNTDQFIRVEKGTGEAILNKEKITLSDGSAIVVPAGTEHNIINIGSTDLKLYTIYSPAEHADKLIQQTKQEGGNYINKYYKYKQKYMKFKIINQ